METELDYRGARFYDADLGRFLSLDPLAAEYPSLSNFVYVADNPLLYIDPDGKEIKGHTKSDAKKMHDDMNKVFEGKQFDKLKALFTRGKKNNKIKFDRIDADALKEALAGLEGDDLTLAQAYTDAINSDEKHTVEYVNTSDDVSTTGTAAFKSHLSKTLSKKTADAMVPGEQMSGKLLNSISGGGLNIPTANGSHSLISEGEGVKHIADERAITSGHEVIGHGVAGANNILGVPNNTRAIRVENLIKRVTETGSPRTEHGGAEIVKPNDPPIRIGHEE